MLGPNGAGKTTLLKAVSGLLPWCRRGDGSAEEHGWGGSPRDAVNAGLVHVVEGHRVFTQLTVEGQRAARRLRACPRHERKKQVEEALDFFPEIKAKRHDRTVTLSGGQQQMLAVTQGLVRKPRLLMLDEPSAGLSPVLVDRVLAAAAQLRAAGTAVLLVEQLIEKSLARRRSRLCAYARPVVLQGRCQGGRPAGEARTHLLRVAGRGIGLDVARTCGADPR